MAWPGEPDAVRAIREALARCEAVTSVALGGSRARGAATALSDWDFYLAGDPGGMIEEIPPLVASVGPLAAFWEPLAEAAGSMVVMSGPTKIDLFPMGATRTIQPPWVASADTIAAMDAHFWDWTLWLGGKALRGERQLVSDELDTMHWFLLAPLGVGTAPKSLDEAVAAYRAASERAAGALGVVVDHELGHQVSDALGRHGLLVANGAH